MKRFVLGVLLGLALPVAADFGWSDTDLLRGASEAAKASVQELKGLREELKGLRADVKKLTDQLEEDRAWRRLKEAK